MRGRWRKVRSLPPCRPTSRSRAGAFAPIISCGLLEQGAVIPQDTPCRPRTTWTDKCKPTQTNWQAENTPPNPSVQDLITKIDAAAKATAAPARVSARKSGRARWKPCCMTNKTGHFPHVIAVLDPEDHRPTRQRSPMT